MSPQGRALPTHGECLGLEEVVLGSPFGGERQAKAEEDCCEQKRRAHHSILHRSGNSVEEEVKRDSFLHGALPGKK